MVRGSAALAVMVFSQLVFSQSMVRPVAADPATIRMAQAFAGGLPPHETMAIVRSMGLRPLGPPTRQGPSYVLRAIDRHGEERRVVLDARYGDVLSDVPVVRDYPGARVVRLPEREFDDDEIEVTPPPYPPRVIPAPRSTTAAPPKQPVPRPRPADPSQSAAAPPSSVTTPEPKPAETPAVKPPEEAPTAKPPVPDVTPLE